MQREEQAHSPTKSEWDSADVKAYKCIQMLALRKASGIVQMQNWQSVHLKARVIVLGKGTAKQAVRSLIGKGVGARKGWWCSNPSVLTAEKFAI